MADLLIAEDLLLLLIHDEKGTVRESSAADLVLGGALLLELALDRRIRITEKGETSHRANRVAVMDASLTDDTLLDEALARLAARPDCKPKNAVLVLAKRVRRPLLDRLVVRGILRHHRTRFFGFHTWPAIDSTREHEVRAGIFRVLVKNEEPTIRQASLIALLSALGAVDDVVAEDVSTVDRKAVRDRAEALMEENWASAAARKVVEAAANATAAAVVFSAGGDGGGGGGNGGV